VTCLLEACVDTLPDTLRAGSLGAGRIELCDNLAVGGTTPSHGMVAVALERSGIPVHPIIRSRGGDFVFGPDDISAMLRDVAHMRTLGAPGVVIGALTRAGLVDRDTTARLRDAAGPMDLTFHKAFDVVRDQAEALETLVDLGIARVLTSGGAPTAWDGRDQLAALLRQAAGRITVMPGGGIIAAHVAELVATTGTTEIHLRATDGARFKSVATAVRGEGGEG
jgi:copper homeostasis protein